MSVTLSAFARNLNVETAFTVLAVARALKSKGKDVVELEIGDSPFESTASAKAAGEQAIRENQSHYCPSPGLAVFREQAARFVRDEFGIPAQAENIVVGPGAKIAGDDSSAFLAEPRNDRGPDPGGTARH